MKLEKAATKNEPYGYNSELSSNDELELSIIQWQSPRYNVWLKAVAVIVVGVFLCQQVVWAGDINDILPSNKQEIETPMQTLGETQDTQQRQQELLEEQGIIEPAKEEKEEQELIAPPVTEQPAAESTTEAAAPEGAKEAESKEEELKEEGKVESEETQEIAEKVYEEVGKEIQETEPEEETEKSSLGLRETGQKAIDAVIAFLDKVRNSAGENYKKFRELLNIYNPQILAQDGFDALVSYLKNQAGSIFNCASFALGTMLGFANDARLAATAIILDILNGVLIPSAQGILKTSLFALQTVAAAIKNITLHAVQITIDELYNIATPFIAHIRNVHYVVVTKVMGGIVTYLDNTRRVFTESILDFADKWKGVVLTTEKLEGAKELSEAEQKAIRGAGLEPADYGFTTGGTEGGTVVLDAVDVYNDDEYSLVLEGNESNNSTAYAETTVTLTEAAQISFAWKVSSESNYDCLKFYIDGVEEDEISGETNWAVVTYNLEAGEHILRWEYVKDGSVSYGDDMGWVGEVTLEAAPTIAESDNTLSYLDEYGNTYTIDYYEEDDGTAYISKYDESDSLIGYRILGTDGIAEDYDADGNLVNQGTYAKDWDNVSVKYTGYLTDGTTFDSNEDSDDLFEFTLGYGEVIEGFDEAVRGMMIGEKITVVIPPGKAYGLEGESAHDLASKTLIFDITVVKINDESLTEETTETPQTPEEIAAAQEETAIKTAEEDLAELLDLYSPYIAELLGLTGDSYITVKSIEAVTWDDSSLGWTSDEAPAQGSVEGYKIILMYNGRTYEYHAATDGAAILDPEVKKNILAEKAIRDRELERRSVRPSAGRSILNDISSRSFSLDDTLDANGNGILDYLEHSLVRHLVDEIDMILADTKTSQSEYEKALSEQERQARERESTPDDATPSPKEEEPLPEITGGALTEEELDMAQAKIKAYKDSIKEIQDKEIDAASKEEVLEGLLNEYETIFSSLPEGHNFTHINFEPLIFDNTSLATAIEKANEAISVLEENIASKNHEAIADNVTKNVPEINEAKNGLDNYISSLNGRLTQLEAQIDAINDYMGVKEQERLAAEAKELRLVNQCYADRETLMAAVRELAATLAEKPPLALRGCKEMITYARDHTVADGLNYVATWNAAMLLSTDLDEALAAGREKRAAKFRD